MVQIAQKLANVMMQWPPSSPACSARPQVGFLLVLVAGHGSNIRNSGLLSDNYKFTNSVDVKTKTANGVVRILVAYFLTKLLPLPRNLPRSHVAPC